MRTRFQNLRSSTALVRPAPSSGLPGQFYVNMVDRIIGFFNEAGQPVDFAYLPLVGGSLTGFLTLHADPTAALHASTKGYSDTQDATLNAALRAYTDAQVATRLPLAGGSLTGFLTLHADPTAAAHAATRNYVDTQVATRLTQAQADARFLQLAGGALTGMLTLPGPPTQPLHAATKEFVEALIAEGGAATHVGDTPPLNPEQGQLWFKTIDPVGLYVWYIDVDSSQWVAVGGGGSTGSVYDAPVGAISYFAGPTAPTGWLVCNGAAVGVAHPDLRAYLLAAGAPFGTSGADPRLPDLRGEFIRGWDNGRGVDPARVFGSAQLDQIQRLVGQLTQVQTIGTGLITSGILRQLASTASAIWQGATSVNRNTTLQLDTDFDPSIRDGAETRGRNVALLPCIKAMDIVSVTVPPEFAFATPEQARAGVSADTLMSPALVQARSGVQTLALTGTSVTFDQVPPEANEISLLLQMNYPANGVVTFDFSGAPLATFNWSRQLQAGAYAPPIGASAVASAEIDTDTQARGLTGMIHMVRDFIGGTWRAGGNYRRNPTQLITFHGSFFMNNELTALPRLNCNAGGFVGGSAAARWRI